METLWEKGRLSLFLSRIILPFLFPSVQFYSKDGLATNLDRQKGKEGKHLARIATSLSNFEFLSPSLTFLPLL